MKEFMHYSPMKIQIINMTKGFKRYGKTLLKQGEWMEAEAKKIFEV